MGRNKLRGMDLIFTIRTPCYVLDEALLRDNLKTLKKVKDSAGCRVLLALKAFSMYSTFPLVRKYLDGVCASGPHEARLGREEFKKEVHAYSSAYTKEGIIEVMKYSDHVIFNSFSQIEQFMPEIKKALRNGKKIGIRVNPEYSEIKTPLYDPCIKNSRLGVKINEFEKKIQKYISKESNECSESQNIITGIHFHALCEQGAGTLKRVLMEFENKFGKYLSSGEIEWVNFGGGHHITKKGYDIKLLIKIIKEFKKKYNVKVIIEPGEAVALNTGYLVASVIDIGEKDNNQENISKKNIDKKNKDNSIRNVILDTSAEAHMPDVLAMPYRPQIIGAGEAFEKKHTYRLSGMTCLAGDIIGEYSFDSELKVGDKLIFLDMAIYSMVKNTTFNGIKLPDIAIITANNKLKIVKRFGYSDFKRKL